MPMVIEEDALSFTDAAPLLGDLEMTAQPLASMTGSSMLCTPSFNFTSEEDGTIEPNVISIIEGLEAELNTEKSLRQWFEGLTQNYRYVIGFLEKAGSLSQEVIDFIAKFESPQ